MKKSVNGVIMDLTAEELAQRELDEQQALINSKPLARGKDLVSFIEKAFTGQPFAGRIQLQSLFMPIKLTLESQTCNPLSSQDFDSVLAITNANSQLTQEQKALFVGLANTWKGGIRFE